MKTITSTLRLSPAMQRVLGEAFVDGETGDVVCFSRKRRTLQALIAKGARKVHSQLVALDFRLTMAAIECHETSEFADEYIANRFALYGFCNDSHGLDIVPTLWAGVRAGSVVAEMSPRGWVFRPNGGIQ